MTLRVLYLSGAERFPEALEGFLDGDPGNRLIRCEAPVEVGQRPRVRVSGVGTVEVGNW